MMVSTKLNIQTFIFGAVVLCVGIIYLYRLNILGVPAELRSNPMRHHVNKTPPDRFTENNQYIQKMRIERIESVCGRALDLASGLIMSPQTPMYLYSPIYNFTYCNVPKCGSTFWTQVFDVLHQGTANADEIFGRNRVYVHRDDAQFLTSFNSIQRQRARAVLVSRDPYSRLFSAYIDKFFIPQMYRTVLDVRHYDQNTTICPKHVSFQEFLTYVIDEAVAGKILDRHWASIVSLCRPCETNSFLLVKQETFSDDIEYALNLLQVEQEKTKIILKKLYDQRIESTVPGIAKTVYIHVRKSNSLKCFGYKFIAEKIWHSFQIQGFLKNSVPFPNNIPYMYLKNSSYFSDRIMNAIASHPMSREDQRGQRRAALVEAYQNVNNDTLTKIKQLYKADFDMFDYSNEPPLF